MLYLCCMIIHHLHRCVVCICIIDYVSTCLCIEPLLPKPTLYGGQAAFCSDAPILDPRYPFLFWFYVQGSVLTPQPPPLPFLHPSGPAGFSYFNTREIPGTKQSYWRGKRLRQVCVSRAPKMMASSFCVWSPRHSEPGTRTALACFCLLANLFVTMIVDGQEMVSEPFCAYSFSTQRQSVPW